MQSKIQENFVPLPYRRVSHRWFEHPMDEQTVRDRLLGLKAYRRTEFIVLENGPDVAVVRVELEDREPLFSPIRKVSLLAGPPRCHAVEDDSVDVGLPSSLGEKALELNVSAEDTLVVTGKYSHVNFIHRPNPLRITVFDVVPPEPSKLTDLVRRVLEYAPVPPIHPQAEIVDLRDRLLERDREGSRYLFPCRASGVDTLDKPVDFLDEHPPQNDWFVVGCRRTREIHREFYGPVDQYLEMCPRELHPDEPDRPLLIRCCQLEEGYRRTGSLVEVPWGAELEDVESALTDLYHFVHGQEGQHEN